VLILTVVLVHVRFVQRGLQKLHNVINEIEGGNMDAHIDLKYTDEMGRLSHAFNSMIDRLNLMRDELKQSHRLQMERADKLASVGEIAAGIAHEIKNPVSGISSAAKILMDEFNSDEEHRPVFQEIVRQTQRVNDAINNLLSFARPREPHFVETDFEFVILRSLKLIREHAKTSRITVEAQALTNIPPVTVDPEQIEQIMVNLMMNAVQAMPEGGTLRILYGYDSERQEVNAQIQDSGIGIPEDNIELVFQPFFTTRHRGTGLGLAIAHNIATSHGGRINVVSRVGSGTTFTVILPVLSTNSADHRDNHEDSTNPHGEA
jgi:two-component system NtrC family sensor kinase